LAGNLRDVEAVVAGSEPYTTKILEAFPQLRVISRVGVGYDSVDVETATRLNMAVATTPGTNHDSVAELTFALLLGIAKRLVESHAMVAAGKFDRRMTRPLRGETLGLVGMGRIGRAVADRGIAFGMRVITHDPTPPSSMPAGVELVSLDDLLRQSDYVSLHAPLTKETRHMIGPATIAKMKPGVVLINTSRGGLVDESALAAALVKGTVAAAGLDVFECEPPVGSPILSAPNVLFTPHVAGIDEEGVRQMSLMACRTIVDLYEGHWPTERIVNAAALGSWRWGQAVEST
jgi:phosphoglycerate dehydrogenase-like enzyme